MKNLMMSEEEVKEKHKKMSLLSEPVKYPGGLCLYIDADTAEKLGFDEPLKPGAKVMMIAKAYVKSSELSKEMGDEKGYTFSIQITDMDMKLKEAGEEKSASDVIYGE